MTQTADKAESVLGQPVRRKEDAHLITGRTLWTDNISLPGMLHLVVLRSPMAHARIARVDVGPARQRPGVVAAYTGADLADSWSTLPMGWTVSADQKTPPHLPLATDKVRYVGDGVAVVLATDPYAAADALEAIEVDYEPLPAVVDMEAALSDGSALVHDDIPNNRCFTFRLDYGDFAATRERADVVVRRRFYNQRLIPNAMEPRAVVVAPATTTGQTTIWSATQVPHSCACSSRSTPAYPSIRSASSRRTWAVASGRSWTCTRRRSWPSCSPASSAGR
jgi:carbon-monoxide dehydrogenase large subunit